MCDKSICARGLSVGYKLPSTLFLSGKEKACAEKKGLWE